MIGCSGRGRNQIGLSLDDAFGGSFRKWLPARLHGFPYHSSQTRLRVATPKSPKNVAKFPAKETEFCTRRDQQKSVAISCRWWDHTGEIWPIDPHSHSTPMPPCHPTSRDSPSANFEASHPCARSGSCASSSRLPWLHRSRANRGPPGLQVLMVLGPGPHNSSNAFHIGKDKVGMYLSIYSIYTYMVQYLLISSHKTSSIVILSDRLIDDIAASIKAPPSPSRATADRTSRPAWWAPESGRAHGPWRGSGTPHRTTPWLGPPPRASKMDILAIRHMGSRVFYIFVNRCVNTYVNINFGVYESIYDYIYIYI